MPSSHTNIMFWPLRGLMAIGLWTACLGVAAAESEPTYADSGEAEVEAAAITVDSASDLTYARDATTELDAAAAAAITGSWFTTGRKTLYIENDSLFIKPNHHTDRHYTSGAGVSFSYQPQWADRLAEHLPFATQNQSRTAGGFVLAQEFFTPSDITLDPPDPEDRPYAGYLRGGVFLQRASDVAPLEPAVLDHLQLDLGIVGPAALGRDTQRVIHELLAADTPRGWNTQLNNEPVIQLYARRKWRLPTGSLDLGGTQLDTQLIPYVGVAVGNVNRSAEAGATYRLGFNLPDDFGPDRLADPRAATGEPISGWSLYAFGRITGRAVEHDIFLDGNTFEDSPSVDSMPFVAESQLGVMAAYRHDNILVEAGYSQTFITEQFENQNGSDAFGSVTLSLTGWF